MKNMFGGRGAMGGGGGRGGPMFGVGGRGRGKVGAAGRGGSLSRSLKTVGKTVSRTNLDGVPATPDDAFPSSSMRSYKHVSSIHPFSFSSNVLYTRKPSASWSSSAGDDNEWVCVDEAENVLGRPPSDEEVDDVVSTLQQVLGSASGDQATDTDWAEPSLCSYNSITSQANGFDRVYYAFHLLRTDPYVQRMVKSLSADKIVWDAVLKNEVVRELREAISVGEEHDSDSGSPNETSHSDSSATTNVFMTMFDTTKTIFMDIIEKITKIANELFNLAYHRTDANGEGIDSFCDKLRTAFILSIMVMMFVVLNRAKGKGRAWYN